MFRRFRLPLSLVNQVVLLMLLLGLLGIAGMAVSSWMSQSIQGNAHAINTAGSLRMQSYRLLSMVPLNADSERYLLELERGENDDDLRQAVVRERLSDQFSIVRHYWAEQLKPRLRQAERPADAAASVADFVHHLDTLVLAIDQKTEAHLRLVTLVQRIFIVSTLSLLLITFFYLRHRLLAPWRKLVSMAQAIGQGEFHQQVMLRGQDEMSTLAQALNNMSDELSAMYRDLEQRVAKKTADLQQKNDTLAFLYRASRRLHTSAPLCSRLLPVLDELSVLMPLSDIRLQLYEDNHQAHVTPSSLAHIPDPDACPDSHCQRCDHFSPPRMAAEGKPISWNLRDKLGHYGVVLARLPDHQHLTPDQHQLLNTLLEQLTSTLALERQSSHQQQLMLMEERATIARELHDSIAQSLSCLKIQISCLQMQHTALTPEIQQQLDAMRDETNTAYRQLRELLTTFRLKLSESGLLAALRGTADEFGRRLGYDIELDYQLPLQAVSAHQGIHLLQIVREALSNIYKHAQATAVSISLRQQQRHIELRVCDNGVGISDDLGRANHYGLIIMRDRARSLHGDCTIQRLASGGTEVCVSFLADYRQPPALSGEHHD
ncbi:nitrate/nitrite two-component system sensor histidine kinase NarX [Dickeya dianthicola]|uniref:nitrate/nitrite two-component system sensor histidine kinase NarX n=1 Tax=Dickeya dianthicola TaxID=204039 RepID=UPI0003A39B31|nr:nitrate/nitrite two-component system sensor histidine kinase NarX [Dickeya dianthicola]MBT1428371.1 nitrate/nitrite two-component system sensor histidine kinase NarX [Dickeya dianthicola]MBT1459889.1 nitrate/nitrite two-component system sensor histidine kinase NarX [Dickeya dianthicola]MBT1489087.1 nitrate/nitrite two-component system sensor histidine kinase NarX [Dickeya dianthicola]MCI4032837.1 nitrate/nitrite two-component system sensor histidine kinase NarX [Dickeya dianthicola]MCI41749